MIALVSFALLVLIALAYVLAPLVLGPRTGPGVCPACGAPSPDRAAFCARCGHRLDDRRAG